MLLAIWPIGSVGLFAGLALCARSRLLAHKSDQFVRDTRFLHRDFRPGCYLGASFELAQRSILTGWLILFPAERKFLALVTAFLTALVSLGATLTLRPYRYTENNVIAALSGFMLTITYVFAMTIKMFEDVSAADESLARYVLLCVPSQSSARHWWMADRWVLMAAFSS